LTRGLHSQPVPTASAVRSRLECNGARGVDLCRLADRSSIRSPVLISSGGDANSPV
jgi:hypothetical protein